MKAIPSIGACSAAFDDELRALKAGGFSPVVIVDDYPAWVTDHTVRSDGQATSCGPIREDKLGAFVGFMQALVARYKTPEFNVHNWELGNEPDIDPNIVEVNNIFGCWGDITDTEYYGGQRYGEMIKVVTPAIKAIDPGARIWMGGLLLDNPNSDPARGFGRPELFFKGVLQAGAAPYIDVVPYHSYVAYSNQPEVDHENGITTSSWYSLGGAVVGKRAIYGL